jgi:L-threonylcarbamoyladenylate synthase
MSDFTPRRARLAPATPENIALAAACLRAGGLVAMPTETVYGLAALATSDTAAASIYAAKGRPSFNPLIAHFEDVEAAAREARLDRWARKLADAFWPGPLTIVAPVAQSCRVSLLARAGLDTLALRVPGHQVARALIAAAGAPLAAPSANRSGRVSPTRAEHVAADLGERVEWNRRLSPASGARRCCCGRAPYRAKRWKPCWA